MLLRRGNYYWFLLLATLIFPALHSQMPGSGYDQVKCSPKTRSVLLTPTTMLMRLPVTLNQWTLAH